VRPDRLADRHPAGPGRLAHCGASGPGDGGTACPVTAWQAENNWRLARLLLIEVALIQLGAGVHTSPQVEAQRLSPMDSLAGLHGIPAILALVAGFLIRSTAARAPAQARRWTAPAGRDSLQVVF